MYIHNISLSFDNLDAISTGIKIKQHDSKFHKLVVSGIDFSSGERAIIKFLRPDGVVVCDEFAYNDSDEYIICSSALAESGTVSAEISVYNGDARITSHTFTFEVVPDINTDYIFTENDTIPLVHSLLNEMRNHVTKEDGKGLSTNDYDNEAKAAVESLEENLSKKEDVSNKVSEISSSSTDAQYPTAKAMYEKLKHIDVDGDCVCLGESTNIMDVKDGNIMIGSGATALKNGVVIGTGAGCCNEGVAIGAYACVAKEDFDETVDSDTPFPAIQLGRGTNSNEKSLQVYDYQVTAYDGDGYLKDVGKLSDLTTTEKGSIVGAVNELENNKLTKTEAEDTYTPFPIWESGKRYNSGDIVFYCGEGYNGNPFGRVSEGYQLYKYIVANDVPNDLLQLEMPPSDNAAEWEYLPFVYANIANMSMYAEYNTDGSPLLAQDNVYYDSFGIQLETGKLSVAPASEDDIKNRIQNPRPITPAHLDYAVRSVKPEIKYSNPAVPDMLSVNTLYYLEDAGTTLDLYLPTGSGGDFIQVDFYSGETPTALTISSSHGITDHDLIPEANTMYSLYFDWGLIRVDNGLTHLGWRFSYAEYPYTEV